MIFIKIERLDGHQHLPLTMNIDEIAASGKNYHYGYPECWVDMKNGTRFWIPEDSYEKLQNYLFKK